VDQTRNERKLYKVAYWTHPLTVTAWLQKGQLKIKKNLEAGFLVKLLGIAS